MTAVIYRTKHGYTKKIAEAISKELDADLFSIKDAKNLDTSKYDSFVLGSSIGAGMFGGKGDFLKLYQKISDKKTAIFTVGMTNPIEEDYYIKLDDMNFSSFNLKDNSKVFHLMGGIDYEKLGFLTKKLMGMIVGQIEKKENKTEEDEKMLKMKTEKVDLFKEEDIIPLIQFIKG